MIALKSIELTVNIIQMCTCECVCAFSNHYHGNEFVLGKKAKKKKKKKKKQTQTVFIARRVQLTLSTNQTCKQREYWTESMIIYKTVFL